MSSDQKACYLPRNFEVKKCFCQIKDTYNFLELYKMYVHNIKFSMYRVILVKWKKQKVFI